ncbi:MAG TPA: hypothetical protein VKH37_05080 [Ferruginibacter sp.]|nr:hypothetical protein [Ferruginibacter sp.]
MKFQLSLLVAIIAIGLSSCKKNVDPALQPPKINFYFKFDSTQARLNNIGLPSTLPAGHGGQSPRFNLMSAHYLELAPNALTPLGSGQVLYRAPEVTTGGSNAIDFSKSNFAGNNGLFFSAPISAFATGTYTYLRVSLAYQNYNVWITTPTAAVDATVASFIGFNTYLTTYKVKDSSIVVNGNRAQGYWALEGQALGLGFVTSGQAPAGSTTVPNPIASTSPIPAGSCVVTAAFTSPLVVTGTETGDININVSLSTNKSFEWIDGNGNNKYEPLLGETVVDMGIRGMIPTKQ